MLTILKKQNKKSSILQHCAGGSLSILWHGAVDGAVAPRVASLGSHGQQRRSSAVVAQFLAVLYPAGPHVLRGHHKQGGSNPFVAFHLNDY